jgi:hypothetical protein
MQQSVAVKYEGRHDGSRCEARKMPLLNDILDNRVLGREFKRGELSLLRRQIEERFGPIPKWAEDRLTALSAASSKNWAFVC